MWTMTMGVLVIPDDTCCGCVRSYSFTSSPHRTGRCQSDAPGTAPFPDPARCAVILYPEINHARCPASRNWRAAGDVALVQD